MRSIHLRCKPCRRRAIPADQLRMQEIAWTNARRARKAAAEIAGPVPAEVYAEIRESGPCVYCGSSANTVDHITPLARGGWEHEINLVPACRSCNSSKGTRLLSEWDPRRVVRAVAVSYKVAAVYGTLTGI
ncbi:HNH endonuclease [Streptomyces sp. NPDC001404]|uniref:HNH endonuclease n=1 Tax=Streptomyces sp. NPDC001404 TaxID=3364571 RepID=UPI0036C755EA